MDGQTDRQIDKYSKLNDVCRTSLFLPETTENSEDFAQIPATLRESRAIQARYLCTRFGTRQNWKSRNLASKKKRHEECPGFTGSDALNSVIQFYVAIVSK